MMATNKKTFWLLLKALPKSEVQASEGGRIRFIVMLVRNKTMLWQCNCDVDPAQIGVEGGASFLTRIFIDFSKNCKKILIPMLPKKRTWDYISSEPSFKIQINNIAPETNPEHLEKVFINLLK